MIEASESGREYFHFGPFVFDVNQAQEIIEKSPRGLRPVHVPTLARQLGLEQSDEERKEGIRRTGRGFIPIMRGDVDEQYALTQADLSRPLLFVDLSKKGEGEMAMLIDGTHRLRRAFVEGVEYLKGYVLTRKETLSVRSEKHYR